MRISRSLHFPPARRFPAAALLIAAVTLFASACETAVAVPPGSGVGLRVPGGIARLAVGDCALPGEVVVTTRKGERLRVKKHEAGYALVPVGHCLVVVAPAIAGMLDDGIVTRGSLTIAKAWLAAPTRRYGHGILGDAVEAGELRVAGDDGRLHTITLDAGSVFEDLMPRVVDLDGDGQEEVLLIRSRLETGASIVLYGKEGGEFRLLAESEPIGRSNRWLNPVGVADFDGDQRREIAVVVTPHIGGILTIYERRGKRLVPKFRQEGFSNHAIGSRELGMSAIVDYNGDGVPDLAVPGADRHSLRIVTFAGGRFVELGNFAYGAEIVTAIVPANFGTQIRPDLVFGLEDGTLVVLPR